MNHWRCLLSPVERNYFNGSMPILTRWRLRMGVNIGEGGRKMGKITVRDKAKEEKDWVDLNGRIFEDIQEGMFKGMDLDEMIQWMEQKLKESQ